MSGTAPQPPGYPRAPAYGGAAPEEPAELPDGGARGRWWLLVVLVVAVVVVLVWRPWAADEPAPVPVPTPTVTTQEPTAEQSPTPTPTPTPTQAVVPGAAAVFDATTAATLFVTGADLANDVPAGAGVTRGVEPGTQAWGLPAGSRVDPESCTSAVTVVDTPPSSYDATSWVNDELTFEQDVVLLLDGAAARAAFRALVTAVDECPRYSQVDEDGQGPTWTAEPALEGQGVFPAIVHEVTEQSDGATFQQTTGHVLVGNAVLTWTATARTANDRVEAEAVLGEPSDLSAMVETRALAAVRALP